MADVRLIDANAALNDLCGSQCGCRIDECGLDEPCEKARCIIRQPTIEAEPVKYGRWNYRHEDDWCYCTACGTDAEGSDGECLETDYCPHCGARMDGGAD